MRTKNHDCLVGWIVVFEQWLSKISFNKNPVCSYINEEKIVNKSEYCLLSGFIITITNAEWN
jgi:hypothetical protein